jgi:basic membrane lipoprotein Med (substrate-binding protein (PBP1-ABC) superfamily)
MRAKRFALAIAAATALLAAGCSSQPDDTVEVTAPSVAAAAFLGPSGLEVEQELGARQLLDAQAAAQAAAEAQAVADAAVAEAQRVADEAAAQAAADAEAAAQAEFDDGYVTDGLERACAQGTATIEQCFGPGMDLNNNGILDMDEIEYAPEGPEPDYPSISCDMAEDGTPICEGELPG